MSDLLSKSDPIGRRHRTVQQLALLVYDYDEMVIRTVRLPAQHIFQPWRPCDAWRGKRIPITLGEGASEFDWGVNTGKGTFLQWDDFFAGCQPVERKGPWDVSLDLSELEATDLLASESVRHAPIIPYTELLVQDDGGRTRLFYAAERGDQAAVEKMIFRFPGTGFYPQRLGFIESKDKDGRTAADTAEQNGHQALADYLRRQAWTMENYG